MVKLPSEGPVLERMTRCRAPKVKVQPTMTATYVEEYKATTTPMKRHQHMDDDSWKMEVDTVMDHADDTMEWDDLPHTDMYCALDIDDDGWWEDIRNSTPTESWLDRVD